MIAKRPRPKQISFKNGSAVPGPNVAGLILPGVRVFTVDDVIELRRTIGRAQQTKGAGDVVESLNGSILSYIANERRRALATPRQQAEWSRRLARQLKAVLATLGVDPAYVDAMPYDASLLLMSDEQGSLLAAALAQHTELPHDHLAAVRRAIQHLGWLQFVAEQASRSHAALDAQGGSELNPRQKLILSLARLYEWETASNLRPNLGLSKRGHPFAKFCLSIFRSAAARIADSKTDPSPEDADIARVQGLARVNATNVRDDLKEVWPALRRNRQMPENRSE